MARVWLFAFLFGFVLIPVFGHEGIEEEGRNEAEKDDSKEFHNKESIKRSHLLAHIADRMDFDGEGLRHIKKHLVELTGGSDLKDYEDIKKGDNMKGIFYFFKLHDFDNNQKLDGLELMSALTDFHDDDLTDDHKDGGKNFLHHEAEAIIDEMLAKHDKNGDGMLHFSELMDTHVKSLMTELDDPPPGGGEGGANDQQKQDAQQG